MLERLTLQEHRPVFTVAALVALFWAAGGVPLGAAWLVRMQPWAAEQPPSGPAPAWDALLWDGVAQVYPWRVLLARGLRSGELALWSPYQYCGYPIVGNGQLEAFYPLNWLLLIVPPVSFLGLSLAVHSVAALALTYALCRVIGLGRWSATFAGLAFAMGGFFVTWAQLPALVNSITWLPGALLGIEALRIGRRWGAPVLAASLGLSLLAGHLQIATYVWLTACVCAVAAVVRGPGRRIGLAGGLLASFAVGLALGCAQLLPTAELGLNSSRGAGRPSEAAWAFQQARALQPEELGTLARPFALGNPTQGTYRGLAFSEHCGYVGLVTLLVAAGALLWRRDNATWALAVSAAAALSIAMAGPLARLLYFGVPGMSAMGSVTRLLSVYTLLIALLGGLGLDSIERQAGPATASRRKHRPLAQFGPPLCVAILVVELLSFALAFLPRARSAQVYPESEVVSWLQSRMGDEGRVLAVTPKAAWRMDRLPTAAILPPNAETVYGLRSAQGYDSLVPRSYVEFAARIEQGQPAPPANGNMMLLERADAAALGLAAVRWMLREGPLYEPSWELRHERGPLRIYENTLARPLVWVKGGGAQVTGASLNSLRFTVTEPGTGHGVVAQTWYPGWRVSTDAGLELTRQAEGPFWSLSVSAPGSARLDFWPVSVVIGLFLSLTACAIGAGSLVWAWASVRSLR